MRCINAADKPPRPTCNTCCYYYQPAYCCYYCSSRPVIHSLAAAPDAALMVAGLGPWFVVRGRTFRLFTAVMRDCQSGSLPPPPPWGGAPSVSVDNGGFPPRRPVDHCLHSRRLTTLAYCVVLQHITLCCVATHYIVLHSPHAPQVQRPGPPLSGARRPRVEPHHLNLDAGA